VTKSAPAHPDPRNVSWNEYRGIAVRCVLSGRSHRGVCAGSALGAGQRSTFNPWIRVRLIRGSEFDPLTPHLRKRSLQSSRRGTGRGTSVSAASMASLSWSRTAIARAVTIPAPSQRQAESASHRRTSPRCKPRTRAPAPCSKQQACHPEQRNGAYPPAPIPARLTPSRTACTNDRPAGAIRETATASTLAVVTGPWRRGGAVTVPGRSKHCRCSAGGTLAVASGRIEGIVHYLTGQARPSRGRCGRPRA